MQKMFDNKKTRVYNKRIKTSEELERRIYYEEIFKFINGSNANGFRCGISNRLR